jgi:hypothetical protein
MQQIVWTNFTVLHAWNLSMFFTVADVQIIISCIMCIYCIFSIYFHTRFTNIAPIVCYLKSTVFWDITPCSPLKVNGRFGGTSSPSSGSKNKPRNQNEAGSYQNSDSDCYLLHASFLLVLVFGPQCGDFPPKRRLTFNGLHDIVSRKILFFITNAVRTSNPTQFIICCHRHVFILHYIKNCFFKVTLFFSRFRTMYLFKTLN